MHPPALHFQDRDPPELLAAREDKGGRPFAVRRYHPSDRAALQAFYDVFEPKRAAQGLPPKGADRVARWLSTVLPLGHHLVALRGAELIGHALLVPVPAQGSLVLEYAVFLREDERGRGVGTELNRIAVETARAAGARRIWLSVEPHNRAAIRSYEKVGFRFLPHTVYSPEAEMVLSLEQTRP